MSGDAGNDMTLAFTLQAADRFARDHDLSQDFFTGNRGRAESLALIDEQYRTERHVFVGTEDAADRAGWELSTSGDTGFLGRLLDPFRKG